MSSAASPEAAAPGAVLEDLAPHERDPSLTKERLAGMLKMIPRGRTAKRPGRGPGRKGSQRRRLNRPPSKRGECVSSLLKYRDPSSHCCCRE
eukprot:7658075-Heterocapsa_arctica.AAC.1